MFGTLSHNFADFCSITSEKDNLKRRIKKFLFTKQTTKPRTDYNEIEKKNRNTSKQEKISEKNQKQTVAC